MITFVCLNFEADQGQDPHLITNILRFSHGVCVVLYIE